MAKKTIKSCHDIPIYGVYLHICFADDIDHQIKLNTQFTQVKENNNAAASLLDSGRGTFGLFFKYDYLSHGAIAHEIFHLICYIFHHIGEGYDVRHQESRAYLTTYITNLVYKEIKKNKIEVL